MGKRLRCFGTATLLGAFILGSGNGAEDDALTLKVEKKDPPKDLAEAVRSPLNPTAIRLLDGEEPVFEFWFVKQLPLKSKPDSVGDGLKAIRETTFMGACAVHRQLRDYRKGRVAAGIYTVRFSLQPVDGDHLGTSVYPYFAVLIPAKRDTSVDGISDYDSLVKESSADTPTGHPIILCLYPVLQADEAMPKLTEPASEHKAVRVKVPAAATSDGDFAVVFDLVYEGVGEL